MENNTTTAIHKNLYGCQCHKILADNLSASLTKVGVSGVLTHIVGVGPAAFALFAFRMLNVYGKALGLAGKFPAALLADLHLGNDENLGKLPGKSGKPTSFPDIFRKKESNTHENRR